VNEKRHLPLAVEHPLRPEPGLVRFKKPVQASMSKTDLLLKCQYWASPLVTTVPEPTDPSFLNEALRFGRAFHKTMEIHLASWGKKRPNFKFIAAKFSIDAKRLEHFFRRAKEFVEIFLKKYDWADHERLVEKKIAYDPFEDTMRFLESTGERDYSKIKSTEFPGTGDLAVIPKNRRLMVLDWKSGQSSYTGKDNGQLLSLSTGLSRHFQTFEADVFIVRIDDDFIEPTEDYVLTSKALDQHRDNLRAAITSALSKNPSMRPGSHCTRLYCSAIEVCPAHAGPLSLRDAIEGVLTQEQKGYQYSRFQAAKKLVEKLGDYWRDDVVRNGWLITDDGWVEAQDRSKETISKASIRRAFDPVKAQEIIDMLQEAGAIEKSEYTQLLPRKDKAK
jgi:hypothetical protein